MVRDGLVGRRLEPTVPPRVYYRLTSLGRSLEQPLATLRAWAEKHMPEIDRANRLSQSTAAGGTGRAHEARAER